MNLNIIKPILINFVNLDILPKMIKMLKCVKIQINYTNKFQTMN